MRLDDMPFAMQTDYIRLTAITYQSFGLDKNKALAETSALFFGGATQNRTGDRGVADLCLTAWPWRRIQFHKKTGRLQRLSVPLERITRLELATSTLARWRSTR